ncbi:MAG TPA: type II toxin-antitoxin system HicA family toxin [Terriglobia bacterium]|nr:type II toxin-antitoxin system HicA family toxin [Terriglobia bacterium]
MPKLRRVSGEEAVRALQRLGFVRIRQRGSHLILKKQTPEGAVGCVVPLHRELAIRTLHGILKMAGINPDEFIENL